MIPNQFQEGLMQVIMSLKKNRQMFFQTTEMQKATKQSNTGNEILFFGRQVEL